MSLWLVQHHLFCLLQRVFMACCVTKATPIHFINGKCHIKKLKSYRTDLTSYLGCISYELLLMPSLSSRYTTNSWTKAISRNQASTSLQLVHTWLKNKTHLHALTIIGSILPHNNLHSRNNHLCNGS